MATFTVTDHAPPAETLGQRIRALRLERNWDQESLSRRLGLSHGTISHVEIGRHALSASSLIAVARIFSVCPAYLMTGQPCEGDAP